MGVDSRDVVVDARHVVVDALAMDTRPPAQAGAPEVREYRLRFYEGDGPIGEWSDIISITTTP